MEEKWKEFQNISLLSFWIIFLFFCGKFVMVSKMESFLSEKLLFDFFMKLNALLSEEWATCHKTWIWSIWRFAERRCPKKIIPKISWRQEEMYYCTTYRNNVLSNSGFFGTFRGDRFWNCGFSVSWKSDRTTPTMIYNGGVQPVSLLYNYVLVL